MCQNCEVIDLPACILCDNEPATFSQMCLACGVGFGEHQKRPIRPYLKTMYTSDKSSQEYKDAQCSAAVIALDIHSHAYRN